MTDPKTDLVGTGKLPDSHSINQALKYLGLGKSRFCNWKACYGKPYENNGLTPKDSWILPSERQAIIDYFQQNPLNGCKHLSYIMMDEDIAYVSHNTVYRFLKAKGLLDENNRKANLKGSGFDQPTAPHQPWHIDVSYINAGDTFYYLCSVLDGYSRFIVQWELSESLTQEACQLVVQGA